MTLRLSEAQLQDIQKRHAAFRRIPASLDTRSQNLIPGGHTLAAKAAKRKAKPKGMNKWESAFARTLEYQKAAGAIVWWAFEPFRIRLADGAFYRPDFVAVDAEGRTSIYEVKGHFREAAKVRLKVAVDKIPYQFYLVSLHRKELRIVPL